MHWYFKFEKVIVVLGIVIIWLKEINGYKLS